MFCIVLYASKNVNCYFTKFSSTWTDDLLSCGFVPLNFHVVKKDFY